MANIDDKTRRMLIQNSDLSRQRIENSRKSRIDAIMDMCSKPDIVWAVWPSGHVVIKGHELFAGFREHAFDTGGAAIPPAREQRHGLQF